VSKLKKSGNPTDYNRHKVGLTLSYEKQLRNKSLYIISMATNLSSLCAASCSNWEIILIMTDYSKLTFFTSNSTIYWKVKVFLYFKLYEETIL
jgi:hypothetical protein